MFTPASSRSEQVLLLTGHGSPRELDALPVVEPTFRLSPADLGLNSIQDITFGADGDLFVLGRADAVDLWDVVVFYWPEWVAAIAMLALFVVVARMIWRIARHPETSEVLYCRRCRYELTGISSSVCPECGRDLNRRRGKRVGRSRSTRLITPMVIVALGASIPPLLSRSTLNRRPSLAHRYEWWSTGIREWSNAHQIDWLMRWSDEAARLVRISFAPAGPPTIEPVLTRRLVGNLTLARSADGEATFIGAEGGSPSRQFLAEDGVIVQVDARTGRELRRIVPPDHSEWMVMRFLSVAGFGPDDETIYTSWRNDDRKTDVLAVTDLQSGATKIVYSASTFVPGNIWPVALGPAAPTRNELPYLVAQAPDGTMKLIEVQWDGPDTGTTFLHVRSLDEVKDPPYTFRIRRFEAPVFMAPETSQLLIGANAGAIDAVDLAGLDRRRHELSTGSRSIRWPTTKMLAVSSPDDLLITMAMWNVEEPSFPERPDIETCMFLGEVKTGRWRSRFACTLDPAESMVACSNAVIDPRAERLGAIAWAGIAGKRSLLIFDVPAPDE